ncbi:hypothetical protein GCM10029964_035070 [Kibdelosporangium lantanae]
MLTGRCLCLMCADYSDRDRLDAVDTGLAADTRDDGWAVRAVPDDELGAGWAYTIGLRHTHQSPEFAVFGLDPDTGMRLVDSVAGLVAGGRQVAAGDVLDEVLDGGHRVVLRSVDELAAGLLRHVHGVLPVHPRCPVPPGPLAGPGRQLPGRRRVPA